MRPKRSLESLVHVEDDRANGAIREGLVNPEDKLSLMQMRERAAVDGTAVVNGTAILLQKGAGQKSKHLTFPSLIRL
jgi:hypothetical protein